MPGPLVSILTPTRNRSAFLGQYLRNIWRQDYSGPIEILIADDSDVPIEPLLPSDGRIRYLRLNEVMTIGAKRNLLLDAARGEFLVNFDDDDYYPPERISHAVRRLRESGRGIAGSSEMFILDTRTQVINVSGPFGPNHATAGTLAFTRAYVQTHRFDGHATRGEEPSITQAFTASMCQLESRKTILALQHAHNTWDKSKTTTRPSPYKLKDFVRDMDSRRFYRSLATPTDQ